jgi:hypothetical protein
MKPIAERFWRLVDRSGGPDACWLWMGRRQSGKWAYGRVGSGVGAHRLSWELHNGPIPTGLCVLHHCDNPPCVNPAHLYVGTKANNSRDMVDRRRYMTDGRNPMFDAAARQRVSEHNRSRAKLTDAQVVALRRRGAAGENRKALAREFGVSPTAVDRIVWRQLYAHLDDGFPVPPLPRCAICGADCARRTPTAAIHVCNRPECQRPGHALRERLRRAALIGVTP